MKESTTCSDAEMRGLLSIARIIAEMKPGDCAVTLHDRTHINYPTVGRVIRLLEERGLVTTRTNVTLKGRQKEIVTIPARLVPLAKEFVRVPAAFKAALLTESEPLVPDLRNFLAP